MWIYQRIISSGTETAIEDDAHHEESQENSDSEYDSEDEDTSVVSRWRQSCIAWLTLVALHSLSAMCLAQLLPKLTWSSMLNDLHVFEGPHLSDPTIMQDWKDTIKNVLGADTTEIVGRLEALDLLLTNIVLQKGGHGPLDPFLELIYGTKRTWSGSFTGTIHCEMYLASGISIVGVPVNNTQKQVLLTIMQANEQASGNADEESLSFKVNSHRSYLGTFANSSFAGTKKQSNLQGLGKMLPSM